MKGVLIECDPAMKQFLLHLDEKVKSNYTVVQPYVLKLNTGSINCEYYY